MMSFVRGLFTKRLLPYRLARAPIHRSHDELVGIFGRAARAKAAWSTRTSSPARATRRWPLFSRWLLLGRELGNNQRNSFQFSFGLFRHWDRTLNEHQIVPN